jgi:hypothetical protein
MKLLLVLVLCIALAGVSALWASSVPLQFLFVLLFNMLWLSIAIGGAVNDLDDRMQREAQARSACEGTKR